MRLSLVCALLAAATLVTTGCDDNGVGRKCLYTGSADGGVPAGITISSPSLECLSRLCYLQSATEQLTEKTYCTAKCTSDEDCTSALIGTATGLCKSRYVCAIPTPNGPFACQPLCMCDDDLVKGFNKDDNGSIVCPQSCQTQRKCPTGK